MQMYPLKDENSQSTDLIEMPKPVVDIETLGAHYSTVVIIETIYWLTISCLYSCRNWKKVNCPIRINYHINYHKNSNNLNHSVPSKQ